MQSEDREIQAILAPFKCPGCGLGKPREKKLCPACEKKKVKPGLWFLLFALAVLGVRGVAAEDACLDECVSVSTVAVIPNPGASPLGFRITGSFTPGEIPPIPRGREVIAEGPILPLVTVVGEDDQPALAGGQEERLIALVGFQMRQREGEEPRAAVLLFAFEDVDPPHGTILIPGLDPPIVPGREVRLTLEHRGNAVALELVSGGERYRRRIEVDETVKLRVLRPDAHLIVGGGNPLDVSPRWAGIHGDFRSFVGWSMRFEVSLREVGP